MGLYCPKCNHTFIGEERSAKCPICQSTLIAVDDVRIKERVRACPICGCDLNDADFKSDMNETYKCSVCGHVGDAHKLLRKNVDLSKLNVPKCPTCGSTNIESVSQTRRSLRRWAFGIGDPLAKAQFECKNCGYKW